MLSAEAQVETDRASRYLVQLCRHTSTMGGLRHRPLIGHGGRQKPPEVQHVEWSDVHGTVRFSEGQWTLHATPDGLTLRVEADDEEALQRLQNGIASRLEAIGRRDRLTVTWRRLQTPPAHPVGETAGTVRAPEGSQLKRRGTAKTIVLLAVGVLVVALHLGLGGAALAGAAWTGWLANGVVALVALKVVFMAGHVVLGRLGIRRGRAFMSRRRSRPMPLESAASNSPAAGRAEGGLVTSEEHP